MSGLPFSDWLAVFRIQFMIHVPTRGQNVLLIFFDLSLEASLLTNLAFTHTPQHPHTMVQGTTKGLQSRATPNNARRAHKAAANTKKGRRTAAPKKAAAIKQATMHKVGPRSFFLFLSIRLNTLHSLVQPTEWCDAGTQRQDQQVR